jgi:tRNA 2-selenouridine synthase
VYVLAALFVMFDRDERARVGILYHGQGSQAARFEAVDIIAPRLPALVRRVSELARTGPVALYCWRGGARSTILGQLLANLGLPVLVLEGGYRAHRRAVLDRLAGRLPSLVVLHGYTGSGKTILLQRLINRYAVLDLEALANHRGSTFGGLGLASQPTQCQFESELAFHLGRLGPGPVLVEAESPTVGAIELPQPLCEAMRRGVRVFLDVPLPVRVANLVGEYAIFVRENREAVETALRYLSSRLPRRKVEAWRELVERGEMERLAEELLRDHYDPLYDRWRKKAGPTFAVSLSVRNMDEAFERLVVYLEGSGLWEQEPVGNGSSP